MDFGFRDFELQKNAKDMSRGISGIAKGMALLVLIQAY